VLVCRTSGQILLYNETARRLLETPEHPGAIGLGRSIFHSLDRDLIVFALDELVAAFGIEPVGRHSALGDALITAELLLRLLPLLEQRGIHTLRQAREAIQQSRPARNRYGRIS